MGRQPLYNLLTMRALASPARRLLPGSLVGLRVTGRRTGRQLLFPVQVAPYGDRLVVYPGHAERKTWWRNVGVETPVEVLLGGRWHRAAATLLRPGDPAHDAAAGAYARRWPRAGQVDGDAVVLLDLAPADQGPSDR